MHIPNAESDSNTLAASRPRSRKPAECRSSALTWVLALRAIVVAADNTPATYKFRAIGHVNIGLSSAALDFAGPCHGLPQLYASGIANLSCIDPILNHTRHLTH